MKIVAIIMAAGRGSRSGQTENKIFSVIDGVSVIQKTVAVFDSSKRVDEIVIVHSQGEEIKIASLLKGISKPIRFVLGGNTRFESVKNALATVEDDAGVLIHDGARPYLLDNDLHTLIKTLIEKGSAILARESTDTVLSTDGKTTILSSSRKDKLLALTPQCFLAKDIKRAYAHATDQDEFTDDAGVYCAFIGRCNAVITKQENKKLTYPEDFNKKNAATCGTGFDLHVLVEGRKLILGGITISHDKGLLGHSDADVLTHAIMDALLSSASLGDIGYHFSDKDLQYKDISSMVLLERVVDMLKGNGLAPHFVSAVIMADKPKLSPYRKAITENLAKALGLPVSSVGITFTTCEGIGTIGREEGIASQCYVLTKEIANG